MTLTPRLEAVYKKIPNNAKYIDVGSDHAYLPVTLLTHGIIEFATVTDVRSGPLKKSRETAVENGVVEKIRFVRANGLEFDTGDFNAVSICGMGGMLIAEILSKATIPESCLLVLQPMTKHEYLRQYLWDNSFSFDENYVLEGEKCYVIMTAKECDSRINYDQTELFIGIPSEAEKSSLAYQKYIENLKKTLLKQKQGLEISGGNSTMQNEIIERVNIL